ncbi:HLH transcription factor [Histoplasma ohiense]|nr:HLH transcription factor [Histoplasma ohiense (nom. inval.)]
MEMSTPEPIHQHDHHLRRASPPPGPFGYHLFNVDSPYDEPPAPPPGPSLLDDTESNMLNNFFMSMDHLDSNDFWFSLGDQDKAGGNFGIEWPEELPPTFEGSTTSLGPFPPFANDLHQEGINMEKTSSSHSSDVLAAASMLYHKNGLVSHDYSTSHILTENNNHFNDVHANGNNHNISSSRTKNSFLPSRFVEAVPPGSSPKDFGLLGKGFHTTKMYFDVERQLGPEQQQRIGALRWGSDLRFSERYHAAIDEPSEEERTKDLLQNLDCLESQSSTGNTRASSPARRSFDRAMPEWASLGTWSTTANNGVQSSSASSKSITTDPTHAEDGARPRKRRKSKSRLKDEDIDIEPPNNSKNNNEPNGRQTSPIPRRSSSSGTDTTSTTVTTTTTKRKKPKTGLSGKPRENLTEEQKRTNHILSEQKRRNLIKQGFDDLCALVPELHGGGFSKSTMLIQAAEWLEDLLHGNELLRNQLDELKRRHATASTSSVTTTTTTSTTDMTTT